MVKKKWIERIEIELGTMGTKSYHRFKGRVATQKIAHKIAIPFIMGAKYDCNGDQNEDLI